MRYYYKRQKTYFVLALENKHIELSQAIKNDATYLRGEIDLISEHVRGLKLDALSKILLNG